MRRRNWISGGLALVLTLSLAGCSLAQPEPAGPERDEFIGYYLIYGPQGEVYENLVDEHWTEYGSETLDLGAYGSISSPRMILAAEEPEEGEYVFPGLEGLSFFFPIFTYQDYGAEDGYNTVRLSGSQLDMTENSAHVNDAGGTDYSWAGTAYYGQPADGGDWGVWRALEVRQMGDGTVYLMDAGDGFDSQGGSFGFGQEIQEKTNVNGAETEQASLSFSVDFEPIPRPNSVTLRQYSGDHVLLAEDALSAQEALTLADGWSVPMAEGTAYTLVVTDNAGGTQGFKLFPEPLDERLPWTDSLWFLRDSGLGWPVTVELTEEQP